MEEVDGIIIHTLRSVGCDIEEDVTSLHQFTTELIVEGTARCLRIITNNDDISYKLPPSMSARFRVGASLATALQSAGYKGEAGYQTFLYSNESDIRKVFIFLIEKLPKETAQAVDEPLGGLVILQRNISAEMAKRLKSPWTPSFMKRKGVSWRGNPPKWQREGCKDMHGFETAYLRYPDVYHDLTMKVDKATSEYYEQTLPFVHQQVSSHHLLAPSLLELNSAQFTKQQEWESEWSSQGLASRLTQEEYLSQKREKLQQQVAAALAESLKNSKTSNSAFVKPTVSNDILKIKNSRFNSLEKLQYSKDEKKSVAAAQASKGVTDEEQQRKREEEIHDLKNQLESLTKDFEQLQLEMQQFTSGKEEAEKESERLEKENEERKEAYKVKKKTMDLLPDAENNLAKLKALVEASQQRLVSLEQQWDQHRIPLEEQYRELKAFSEKNLSQSQRRLEEIKRMQAKIKEAAADSRGKEELYKQLMAEYERMTKDVNRSAYTKRILEIVGNIKKQKEDIEKVLVDTKVVQKEINQLSGKLDRTFTVTDELVFRDAKKDEAVRKTYKYLAALHENCSLVIATVEETGAIMREIRDLEDLVEQESRCKVKDNLETMTKDLQQMKQENALLMQKYKEK